MKLENFEGLVNDIFPVFIHYFTRINLKSVIDCLLYTNTRTNEQCKFVLKLLRHVSVLIYHLPFPVYSAPHTHTPNQELHRRPHLPMFYHNNVLLYCMLPF